MKKNKNFKVFECSVCETLIIMENPPKDKDAIKCFCGNQAKALDINYGTKDRQKTLQALMKLFPDYLSITRVDPTRISLWERLRYILGV